jgi:hypothetical protein
MGKKANTRRKQAERRARAEADKKHNKHVRQRRREHDPKERAQARLREHKWTTRAPAAVLLDAAFRGGPYSERHDAARTYTEIRMQLAQGQGGRGGEAWRRHYRELLDHAATRELFAEELYGGVRVATALAHVARLQRHWVRAPADYVFRSHNAARNVAGWLHHLMGRYPVPAFLYRVFARPRYGEDMEIYAGLAQGANLRHLERRFSLTQRQAHLVVTSKAPTYLLAVREALVGTAGGKASTAHAIATSFLREPQRDERFWTQVITWICQRDDDLGADDIGPVLDFIRAQRGERPTFSMKGRTVASLLRDTRAWHRDLRHFNPAGIGELPPSGIDDVEVVMRANEGGRTVNVRWEVVELRSGRELYEEGRAMQHCVYSYAPAIRQGRCAIFSVRAMGQRALTLEVALAGRAVVQARGRTNRAPRPDEQRVVRQFCAARGLGCSW